MIGVSSGTIAMSTRRTVGDAVEEILAGPEESDRRHGRAQRLEILGPKRFQTFSPSARRKVATDTATTLRSRPSAVRVVTFRLTVL